MEGLNCVVTSSCFVRACRGTSMSGFTLKGRIRKIWVRQVC